MPVANRLIANGKRIEAKVSLDMALRGEGGDLEDVIEELGGSGACYLLGNKGVNVDEPRRKKSRNGAGKGPLVVTSHKGGYSFAALAYTFLHPAGCHLPMSLMQSDARLKVV